ncbi:DUF2857 domain-containing protein [Azotobacter salinestris]|uniref:DUF2857 domain-containing protein n=1 Tax=Azotobacter salinestris TaxID=69964 RepID=UPI0032DEA6BD
MSSSSSSLHPLNLAIINMILDGLRNGELGRCKALGFREQELRAIGSAHHHSISVLACSSIPWYRLEVDGTIVQRLLEQGHRSEEDDRMINRAIRLGATVPMLNQTYGLNHREVALRRSWLDLPKRRGRWPDLTELQERSLWERWVQLTRENPIDLDDCRAKLDIAMLLAEEYPEGAVSLAMIWTKLHDWIEEGLV